MKHVLHGLLIVIVSTFALIGCGQIIPPEDQIVEAMIELDSVGGAGLNGQPMGGSVSTVLINQSKEEIWFPSNFNIELFMKINDAWVPVENGFNYGERETILIPYNPSEPRTFILSTTIVSLFPVLPDNSTPAEMHMTVTGFIVENGTATNESTSAEIDFVLSP